MRLRAGGPPAAGGRLRARALLAALAVSVAALLSAEGRILPDARATGRAAAESPFGPAPALESRAGVAVSASAEASEAGAEVLAAGGNAVDGAVAVALALAVTYPQAGNLSGGGFAVLRTGAGEVHALDFRETAPAGTYRQSFVESGADPVTSMLAVATPATVRGLAELHGRFGRLPWSRLVEPSIRLARGGFVVSRQLSADIGHERPLLSRWPASRELFLPGGQPLAPGTRLVQADLARTFETIAREGADGFHRGPVAAAVSRAVREGGGRLSEADLDGYRPVWRPPVVIDFRGFRLATVPLPSSGGFVLRSILAQLEVVGEGWRALGTPSAIHLVAEAERRAYADRNTSLGDADCVGVPLAELLSPARLASLGLSIDPRRATPSRLVAGGSPRREREETTHLCVATPDGEAVSLTTTLNGAFGNGAVVPGTGVLLNNEMDDFNARPGRPNLYELVQGEANTVRAGARPLSSMSPAIVTRDGRPVLVLGSPGGSTIPTTVLQVFLAAGPGGRPLAEAVERPRTHHQHVPDALFVEKGTLTSEARAGLVALGHEVREREPIGRVHAIAFGARGTVVGVADPRGEGRAASVEGARRP